MSIEEVQSEQIRLASIHAQIAWELQEARAREKYHWALRGEPQTGPLTKELADAVKEVKRLEEAYRDARKAYKAYLKEAAEVLYGEQQRLFDPDRA